MTVPAGPLVGATANPSPAPAGGAATRTAAAPATMAAAVRFLLNCPPPSTRARARGTQDGPPGTDGKHRLPTAPGDRPHDLREPTPRHPRPASPDPHCSTHLLSHPASWCAAEAAEGF